HETTDREIETRRAVLALVVTVGFEVLHRVCVAAVAQYVLGGTVDVRVAAAAAFVREATAVADAGDDQPMPYARRRRFVAGEPDDGADRPGDEQEPVCVARPAPGDFRRERRGERDAGKIVVAERGMA